MEHMRHHHKPNIFFLWVDFPPFFVDIVKMVSIMWCCILFWRCESCRTKLRSYRGLLTHLHTCSKMPRGKTKSTEPMAPPTTAVTNPNITPMLMDQNPPLLDSVSTPQELSLQILNPEGSFPAAVPVPDSAEPPLLGPPFLSNPEISPPQLAPQQVTEVAPQPQLKKVAVPHSLNIVGPSAAPDLADNQGQHQTQTRSPGSAPHSPPGSSAVWKKNQGEPLLGLKHIAVTCQTWGHFFFQWFITSSFQVSKII